MPEQPKPNAAPIGEPSAPVLSSQQRVGKLIELSSQFGGSSNIPEANLTELGYMRKIVDGNVSLVPVELERKRDEENAELANRLETKKGDTPFERFSISIGGAPNEYRFIHSPDMPVLESRLMHVGETLSAFEGGYEEETVLRELFPSNPLPAFWSDMKELLNGEVNVPGDKHGFQVSILHNNCFFMPLDQVGSSVYGVFPDAEKFLEDRIDEANGELNTKASGRMHTELERIKGRVTDKTVLNSAFNSYLDKLLTELLDPNDFKDVIEYCNALGLRSVRDVVNYYTDKYLEDLISEEDRARFNSVPSYEEKAKIIRAAKTNAELSSEEAVLKAKIKSAPVEEKKQLSGKLKQLDQERRRRAKKRMGVANFFSLPDLLASTYEEEINNVQRFLANPGRMGTQVYVLDPTPDPVLDKNPGRVSGDCTDGRPLPFDDPDVPVYNVKIKNSDNEHVGNMYLLVTHTEDAARRPVWHFDAIQLPDRSVDWGTAAKEVITSLGEKAKEKGVEIITVNSNEELISNFDYISSNVVKYWEEVAGKKKVNVAIPSVSSANRSAFQGGGRALVLWENREVEAA